MIEVKRDHNLELPQIVVPITNESGVLREPDAGDIKNQQTKVDGIVAPLIKINNITVHYTQVVSMHLTCSPIPRVDITVDDTMNIASTIDSPNSDNRVQVQIIPSVENTYKKINLVFFITDSSFDGSMLSVSGSYYVPKLYDSFMEAYGQISTYELFDTLSNQLSLGFSSNVSETGDLRWIYNPNRNVVDLMEEQISFAALGSEDVNDQDLHVFDWWIGWNNDINFVDVYQEYASIESEENIRVWIDAIQRKIGSDEESKPEMSMRMFTNMPTLGMSSIYIQEYRPISLYPEASDINLDVFSMDDISKISTVIMDGDMKNNILMKYIYGGEVFGEYDYLTRRVCRNTLLSKVSGNTIEVTARIPMFGYTKGSKVNLYWFDINNFLTADAQVKMNEEIESNIPLPDSLRTKEADIIINKNVSGQYYIIDTELDYNRGSWEHRFKLGKCKK